MIPYKEGKKKEESSVMINIPRWLVGEQFQF
jgi:hypothetical protein